MGVRLRIVVAVMLLAIAPSGAHAAPYVTEFGAWRVNAQPLDVAIGGDGALWFSESANPGAIARRAADGARTGLLGGIAPGFTGNQHPGALVAHPSGDLWVLHDSAVMRVAPDGTVTEHAQAMTRRYPIDIVAGPDGALWFTQSGGSGAIGRLSPAGSLVEYTDGLTAGSEPWGITAGPDGALWFTERKDPGRIARITTSGAITEFPLPVANRLPTGIAAGPDGALWFTLSGSPAAIGRITVDGQTTLYSTGLAPSAAPAHITSGGDGALWFTSPASHVVGRITTTGDISTVTDGLRASAEPRGIAPGPDGRVWFAEFADPGRLGRITIAPGTTAPTASEVAPTGASMVGSVRPNGSYTVYHFEYRDAGGSWRPTPSALAGGGADAVPVRAGLQGLEPERLYEVRLVAANDAGTTIGEAALFSTPAPTPEPTPEPPAPHVAAPAPVLGRAVVLAAGEGSVSVRMPGRRRYRALAAPAAVPVGSLVDTRLGTVRLTAGLPGGATQDAEIGRGLFRVGQSARTGRTDLRLAGGDFEACRDPGARTASASAVARDVGTRRRRRVVRRLWAKDRRGRFRTHGSNSVATVRGTEWVTVDRCDGTLTRVREGAVAVRAKGSKRSVLVRAGGSRLVRARRAR